MVKQTEPAPQISLAATAFYNWTGDLTIVPLVATDPPSPEKPGAKTGDVLLIAGSDGKQQLQVSLGRSGKLTPSSPFKAGEAASKWLLEHKAEKAGMKVSAFDSIEMENALEKFCEGMLYGSFQFDAYLSCEETHPQIAIHLLTDGTSKKVESLITSVTAVMTGVNLTRRWAHEPPNVINPITLGKRAAKLAKEIGVKCKVYGAAELDKMGAGAILAVGAGSKTPSQLITLEYPGRKQDSKSTPVLVVGKTITFDSGGYSLKVTPPGMLGMKFDKCGGMAVFGILKAAAELELPVPVVGIVAAAENMVSSEAYRPNDIITSLSGKTIEIISTDAEGRMVLSDALTFACTHYQPRVVIDLATLTGGVVTALGNVRAGLMSNNDVLAGSLFASGERTYERLWRFPLDEEYFELIRGSDSDIKNSAGVPLAHTIVGGMFLKQFVPEGIPWAHIDIAGTATVDSKAGVARSATGFGVRLILDYLQHME